MKSLEEECFSNLKNHLGKYFYIVDDKFEQKLIKVKLIRYTKCFGTYEYINEFNERITRRTWLMFLYTTKEEAVKRLYELVTRRIGNTGGKKYYALNKLDENLRYHLGIDMCKDNQNVSY